MSMLCAWRNNSNIIMGYCTPNNPENEPYLSWVKCPDCNGEGWIENKNEGYVEKCSRCDGEGEIVFEQE